MRHYARTLLPALLGSLALVSLAHAASTGKVEICHFPPGNPANFQDITVGAAALPAHLAHGDFLGPCGPAVVQCICFNEFHQIFSTTTCISSVADCNVPTLCDEPCREFLAMRGSVFASSEVRACLQAACVPQ